MKKFEVGKIYRTRFINDADFYLCYRVVKRTSCTITIQRGDEETAVRRICKASSEHRGAETIYPFGVYSMAPVLSADNLID